MYLGDHLTNNEHEALCATWSYFLIIYVKLQENLFKQSHQGRGSIADYINSCCIAEIDLYYYAWDEPQRNSNAINQHTNQHCITFERNGSLLLWRQLILFNEAEDFIIEKRQLWDIRVPGCRQFSSICRFITNLTKSKSSEVRQVPVWSHPSTSALRKLGLNCKCQMEFACCIFWIM